MITKPVTPSNLGNELLIEVTKVLWTHLAELHILMTIYSISNFDLLANHIGRPQYFKRLNERLGVRRKRCWLRTSINRPPAESDQTTKLFYKIAWTEMYPLEHGKFYRVIQQFGGRFKWVSASPVVSFLPSKVIRGAYNPWNQPLEIGGELLKEWRKIT